MNIIENLESLIKLHSWDHEHANGDIEKLVSVDDLRAIIEEYKNQEPSAWKYRYHEEGDWIISKDRDIKTEGWVREQYPNFTIFPLFTHPPLSDETELKDKYNQLIMAVASKFPNETRHETALRYIMRAEEGSNNHPETMKASNAETKAT